MQTVVLNTNNEFDLRLISALARELNVDLFSISKEEQEIIEDLKLVSFMQDAVNEGFADKKETLLKLGIE